MIKIKSILIGSILFCLAISNSIAQDVDGYQPFGASINAEVTLQPGELMNELSDADSVHATIAATVEEVCQMKGCWMNVSGDNHSLFVKFKDYGFFVPKDIAGQEVIMEGTAYRQLTSVEDLKHYAKDAGKSQEEIDLISAPKEEVTFVANGVLIKK